MKIVLPLVLIGLSAAAPLPAEVKASFRRLLRDPESAQYSITVDKVLADKGFRVVCGDFNAKNAYGGYVGFRRFAYTSKDGGTLHSANAAMRGPEEIEVRVDPVSFSPPNHSPYSYSTKFENDTGRLLVDWATALKLCEKP